ncbi:MAG: hypothetical protein WCJ02_06375 [bacterium]
MKVVLHLRTMCVLFGLAWLGSIVQATEPVAQEIPCTWDFSAWETSSTNYPPGVIGWKIGADASTQFILTPLVSDAHLIAPSSASDTSGGVHNYAGKLGMLDSGSGAYALACAINTIAKTNITVVYDIMTIRNPFDGTTNTRTNECTLQYRVGATGNFTPTGMTYTNDATQQKSGTMPQNPRTQTFAFPSACANQPIVQLRWTIRDLSGKGLRPSFAIGRIEVTGEIAPTGLCSPQNISVTNITATSFGLIWDVVPQATAYTLDIYTCIITPDASFFGETFDGFDGAGNTSRETMLDAYTQTNGWAGTAVYESLGSIRLGNSSTRGWIQTPRLTLPDRFSICFDAISWDGTSEATTIDVFALQETTTNVLKTIQLSKTEMQSFVIQAEAASGSILGFTAKRSTNNRFYLDNLSLTADLHTHSFVSNNMSVPSNTAIIPGLTPGRHYQGVIRAINGSAQSANSSEFSAKTFTATLITFN